VIHNRDFYRHIGSQIKKARKEAGMTQWDLALAMGYKNITSIYRFEIGEQRLTIEQLVLVGGIFKKDINYFI